jgi:hypothetical protein
VSLAPRVDDDAWSVDFHVSHFERYIFEACALRQKKLSHVNIFVERLLGNVLVIIISAKACRQQSVARVVAVLKLSQFNTGVALTMHGQARTYSSEWLPAHSLLIDSRVSLHTFTFMAVNPIKREYRAR